MTKQEYAEYEETVNNFFEQNGINSLSTGLTHCPNCEVQFEMQECPQCGKDAGEFPNEPYFSWSPCDCCNTHEGGNREDATAYNPITKEIFQFTICEDCAYYAEYGRLDDMTMDDIENSPN